MAESGDDEKRDALLETLVCPRCLAWNRPSTTYIDLELDGSRAYCCVCAYEGPVGRFRPPAIRPS